MASFATSFTFLVLQRTIWPSVTLPSTASAITLEGFCFVLECQGFLYFLLFIRGIKQDLSGPRSSPEFSVFFIFYQYPNFGSWSQFRGEFLRPCDWLISFEIFVSTSSLQSGWFYTPLFQYKLYWSLGNFSHHNTYILHRIEHLFFLHHFKAYNLSFTNKTHRFFR